MLRDISHFVASALKKPIVLLLTLSVAIISCLAFAFSLDLTSVVKIGFIDFPIILLALGVLAGVLQLIGYFLYLTDEHIDPNPVTWFMFAYGTLVLAVLEWDIDATFAELILPTVCGILSIVVSVKCWKQARIRNPNRWWPEDWWPEDYWDRFSFVGDIIITMGYMAAWALATFAILSADGREWAVVAFLFLSNLSTFPAFYPIFNSTYKNPERENWLPWAIWAVAYAILALVTYLTHDKFWHALMFYPLSNAFLHAIVAILAVRPTVHNHEKIICSAKQN
jgi:hypothetical protein